MGYFTTVVADAPVHWWRLADPGGSILHDIGSGTKIPLYADAPLLFPYRGMCSDGLAAFRGGAARMYNSATAISLGTSFSLEAWVWPFFIAGTQEAVEVNDAAHNRTGLRITSTGKGFAFIEGQPTATGATTMGSATWHHLVETYDHVTLRLYVDGAPDGTAAFVATPPTNDQVWLGQEWDDSNRITGFLEDVAIYSTVLSAGQVAAHYAAADLRTQMPNWAGSGGSYPTTTSSSTLDSDQMAAILASVRKAY